MSLLHFYRTPFLSAEQTNSLVREAQQTISPGIRAIETEACFNVETQSVLSASEQELLTWLLRETFEPGQFADSSFLDTDALVLEVGPRMSFSTAWSTNAVSVCHACGLEKIGRIERSRRYLLRSSSPLTKTDQAAFLALVHDRMTECPYPEPLTTFETGITPEPAFEIPLIQEGRAALERINREMGLAFDDWDLDYYTTLFLDHIKRNPTNVECFDIAQSNSEHSRHWFFRGKLIVDGEEIPDHLIAMVQAPLKANPNNSTIAFNDNSSAIRGYSIRTLIPVEPGSPGSFSLTNRDYQILFTAETHNFPSGVAPFPGAETGTGGRIRDVHATGRGSLVVAGTAAYCVGNLHIPGYKLPWENSDFRYPDNLATPLQIELKASNGASDYGNKFGEPLIQGYTRSLVLGLTGGERREWIKPIMFSAGIGQIDAQHTKKGGPEKEMWAVKLGGPAYRIGMGGGAASSMVQGENAAELDFNAVQRGDAEMEQKVNRVIRACVELGDRNPIVSIHDQGAGGNCNVLKEIVEPEGARIQVRDILVGDHTLSVLEIWGAEYQENDALLLRPEHEALFKSLCDREKVPTAFVGRITGDGKIVLYDELDGSTPVDMELDKVLGAMPQKTFKLDRVQPRLEPLKLPENLSINDALERVLRLVSVGSKRFLTNKVDRSVTGLIARQQCAGPLQLTVSDVAVIAQSHFGTTGAATAIGEQPILGLLNPAAMARMTVGEAFTNLVWAKVSSLEDVKCSGNWMWAAKLPGEGAALYDAAAALRDILLELGAAIDGGKDSLSMAARAPGEGGKDETVKAPGALVVSAYVTCPDITKTVTPDLKLPGNGRILFVDLPGGNTRLGGSALAQVYEQIGDTPPDVDDPDLLKRAFNTIQTLIGKDLIRAGHDRSDGGLVTTLLEMAFSGNCGLQINLPGKDPITTLFAEELGLALEVAPEDETHVLDAFKKANVPCSSIGVSTEEPTVHIQINGQTALEADVRELRDLWEETSYRLERLQANPDCVQQERDTLPERTGPRFTVPFIPEPTSPSLLETKNKIPVAIVREEGSNGDREMTSAFFAAGFEPWDITMSDLLAGRATLDRFRGVVFVGGFSYADVLDSAKGWAGVIRYNTDLWQQFETFYNRPDTFSLGVCNGCQLMALLGWVPWRGIADEIQPRFIHNSSGRFESRFSTVQIQESPSMMLSGMAGASLGVWVAHGEGRAFFPDSTTASKILAQNLAPVRYVNDENQVTQTYPFNPNGSPHGIAGLCSPDGRHLAMMPHPERAFLKWQWGFMPEDWKRDLKASPWLKMFQNARTWCEKVQVK
ncbi:MAG: phosphoribosylformylglycinamidine synthase [bacterium]|nr:phosphoribosylformylglycinamidine synthase [bacterium]